MLLRLEIPAEGGRVVFLRSIALIATPSQPVHGVAAAQLRAPLVIFHRGQGHGLLQSDFALRLHPGHARQDPPQRHRQQDLRMVPAQVAQQKPRLAEAALQGLLQQPGRFLILLLPNGHPACQYLPGGALVPPCGPLVGDLPFLLLPEDVFLRILILLQEGRRLPLLGFRPQPLCLRQLFLRLRLPFLRCISFLRLPGGDLFRMVLLKEVVKG